MRIALIHSNDGSDVRVGKTCRSLARLGFDMHFIGWDRRPEAPKSVDLGATLAHITARDTRHGRGTLGGQMKFVRHVLRSLRELRPEVVCAVNEEIAFTILPFKGWFYRRLVCDIYDSLQARVGQRPWPLSAMLAVAGRLALRGADRLIATDETRRQMLGQFASKAVVIENVPEDPGQDLAAALPQGPVRIWAAGSLDQGRGLRQLLEAIETLPNVSIVSAGWPYDDFASQVFVPHPRVEFHGIVTARESLELAAGCDAIFAYYEPGNAYMVNASPNKVYDAMAVGRPVLINREVRLARWVEEARVGYTCDYRDVNCLRSVLAGLESERGALPGFAARVRELFLERYQWAQMESRLAALYEDLGRADSGA